MLRFSVGASKLLSVLLAPDFPLLPCSNQAKYSAVLKGSHSAPSGSRFSGGDDIKCVQSIFEELKLLNQNCNIYHLLNIFKELNSRLANATINFDKLRILLDANSI